MTDRDHAPVDDEVRKFVEHAGLALAEWGFPPMSARVLIAAMTVPSGVVSAPELGERLDASPAAISGAVRYLGHLGMLIRVPGMGSRRNYYRIQDELWYGAALTKNEVLFARLVDVCDEGITALGGPDTEAGERVAEMRDFLAFMRAELPGMLERWRTSRSKNTAREASGEQKE
ncbi:MAG: MarR family transcriptional regulator [Streptosporangiales bacterium]|nr:MarR family transcriptional regulator [Streptosporangiales bacterium]